MYEEDNNNIAKPYLERWENPANYRYYIIYLNRDLLNDWSITRIWGSKISANGKIVHTAYLSYKKMVEALKIVQIQRQKRGYYRVNSHSPTTN